MKNINDKIDNDASADGQLTAEEFNDHKNELQNFILKSGQTLTAILGADVFQLAKGVSNYLHYGSFINSVSGVANAYIVDTKSIFHAPTAIEEGMEITFLLT